MARRRWLVSNVLLYEPFHTKEQNLIGATDLQFGSKDQNTERERIRTAILVEARLSREGTQSRIGRLELIEKQSVLVIHL